MPKQRLDTLLAARGLFPSRSQAAASVMAGQVRVGSDGRRAQKPGEMVDPHTDLAVDAPPGFVSRGGTKLANALAVGDVEVSGRRAIDVGASTGGFTDCLLQHGAAAVICVDVGYGDLDWRLRTDSRVTVLERTNARHLDPAQLPFAPDLATIDVSFISLQKVLAAVLACLAPRFDVLALVKPQFEVGRENVGRGGVVRDPALRRGALIEVALAAMKIGASVIDFHPSGLPGPKGNRETFLHMAESGRPGAAADRDDVEHVALRAEP